MDVRNRQKHERKIASIVARLLAGQAADLIERIPESGSVPAGFWDEAARTMQAELAQPLIDIYSEQAAALMDELGVGVDWAEVNQQAIDFVAGYGFEMITRINESSAASVQKALELFFAGGVDRQGLEALIVGNFGPIRAESIAITEVTRAAYEGEQALIDEINKSGLSPEAIWQTSFDDKVCPICRPLNGRQADGYENGRPYWIHPDSGERIGPPPDPHPRDRCFVNWTVPQ